MKQHTFLCKTLDVTSKAENTWVLSLDLTDITNSYTAADVIVDDKLYLESWDESGNTFILRYQIIAINSAEAMTLKCDARMSDPSVTVVGASPMTGGYGIIGSPIPTTQINFIAPEFQNASSAIVSYARTLENYYSISSGTQDADARTQLAQAKGTPKYDDPTPVSLTALSKIVSTSDRTIYVDAVNGNDTNAGTLDKPLKTIAQAFRSYLPLVLVHNLNIVVISPSADNVSCNNIIGSGTLSITSHNNVAFVIQSIQASNCNVNIVVGNKAGGELTLSSLSLDGCAYVTVRNIVLNHSVEQGITVVNCPKLDMYIVGVASTYATSPVIDIMASSGKIDIITATTSTQNSLISVVNSNVELSIQSVTGFEYVLTTASSNVYCTLTAAKNCTYFTGSSTDGGSLISVNNDFPFSSF